MNNIIKNGEHNCDVCNVFLKTKHNLNKHYESKKHKQKSIISTQETPIPQETPRKTRDHKKCQETERSVTRFFENNVGKIITLNGRECKIISMLKKNIKNDTAFSVEDVINKNVLNIGIQTKGDDALYVENWMNIEKFIHKINKQNTYTEKEKTDAIDELYQLENSVFNTLYKYKDMLKKYRNKKGKTNAKFVKLSMSVAFKPNTIPTPIKSKLLKMLFITGGVDNKSDEFYYISKKHNETFEITNLKKVDDEFITNKNLYFYTRMIYTSSGKTQNNMCDYFSFKGSINGKTFSVDFKNLINT